LRERLVARLVWILAAVACFFRSLRECFALREFLDEFLLARPELAFVATVSLGSMIKEMSEPDRMYLNPSQIVFVETG
jgi:hypothetical protein